MSLVEERVGHMRQQQVTSLKNLALRQYRGHDSAASPEPNTSLAVRALPSATPDETQGPRSSSEQQGATSRSVPTNFDAKKRRPVWQNSVHLRAPIRTNRTTLDHMQQQKVNPVGGRNRTDIFTVPDRPQRDFLTIRRRPR
ncbi:hypothetical protein PGT21_010993 [Puccinia graminis f. sp. tritici]|uniref:Uncharacterized protein n=1 Tax=Puccinia graminis f. sp. tritici TaxID=56615 RepID=A0A5B0LTV4_PUCGR|nr:hypothetical protein PGTUg99_028391 [Puccinia graminis f. sp. tritici]KAA1071541.1 hypothetical protein PGT21_010993 [Puccinia graminis f. sp. tritici]